MATSLEEKEAALALCNPGGGGGEGDAAPDVLQRKTTHDDADDADEDASSLSSCSFDLDQLQPLEDLDQEEGSQQSTSSSCSSSGSSGGGDASATDESSLSSSSMQEEFGEQGELLHQHQHSLPLLLSRQEAGSYQQLVPPANIGGGEHGISNGTNKTSHHLCHVYPTTFGFIPQVLSMGAAPPPTTPLPPAPPPPPPPLSFLNSSQLFKSEPQQTSSVDPPNLSHAPPHSLLSTWPYAPPVNKESSPPLPPPPPPLPPLQFGKDGAPLSPSLKSKPSPFTSYVQ